MFVPLSEQLCIRKTSLLLKHFKTQLTKHWFTSDTFAAMHRIRGIECASNENSSGLAEAFVAAAAAARATLPDTSDSIPW